MVHAKKTAPTDRKPATIDWLAAEPPQDTGGKDSSSVTKTRQLRGQLIGSRDQPI